MTDINKQETETTEEDIRLLLVYFIDESKVLTRKIWAMLLDTSEYNISQWVEGKKIPPPKIFNRLVGLIYLYGLEGLQSKNETYKEKMEELTNLVDKKTKIFKNHSTLGDYILESEKEAFLSSMDKLPFVLRKEIFLSFLRISNTVLYDLKNDLSNASELKNKITVINL